MYIDHPAVYEVVILLNSTRIYDGNGGGTDLGEAGNPLIFRQGASTSIRSLQVSATGAG